MNEEKVNTKIGVCRPVPEKARFCAGRGQERIMPARVHLARARVWQQAGLNVPPLVQGCTSRGRKEKHMRRSYKFRAYCNVGTQKRALWMMYGPLAEVWNLALKQRQDTYKAWLTSQAHRRGQAARPVSSYKDPREYAIIKGKDAFPGVNKWTLQDVLVKLDGSYRSFFDLCKKDPLARPPKEKNAHRCIVYKAATNGKLVGAEWDGKNLYCKNIGRFKVRLHRPIEGRIKTVSVTQNRRGHWYVSFSCELPDVPALPVKNMVQIEFVDGLFLRDSHGREIPHPEFYFTHIDELRRLSRALSRKEKGSKNRRKARRTLAKFHEHIANKRKYFLWSIANEYVQQYDLIVIPKWPAKEKIMHATNSRTAMRFCDSAYALFLSILKQTAEKNGKKVEELPAKKAV